MFKRWLAKIGITSAIVGVLSLLQVAQAAGEMKNICLSVYMYPIGSPSAFFKDNLTELHGVDVDIVKEMQRRLGFELKDDRIYPISYTDALIRLENHEIDLFGGGISYTAARAAKFDHTPIYIDSALGVVYSTIHNKGIKSVKDLKGLRIATDFSGSNGLYVRYIKQFGAEPVEMSNLSYALFMVAQGRIDGVLYDRLPIEDFAINVKEAYLSILDSKFGMEVSRYAFYMPKNAPYNKYLSETMQAMLDDGTIDRILKKWKVKKIK